MGSSALLGGCGSSAEDEASAVQIAPPTGLSQVAWGERLYQSYGCFACHPINGAGGAGGHLDRLWGSDRPLHDGTTAAFDEAYVRESILEPSARIVRGMPNQMPSYGSLVSEAELEAIVAFLSSLR